MKISFSKRNRKSNIFSINSTDQGNTLAHTVIFLLSSRGFLGPLKEEMSKMLARCKQDAILSCFSRVNDDRCSNCHVSDSLNNNFSCKNISCSITCTGTVFSWMEIVFTSLLISLRNFANLTLFGYQLLNFCVLLFGFNFSFWHAWFFFWALDRSIQHLCCYRS